MSPPHSAHRPEFTVRCACGIEYHTSNEHIGKQLPCRCGRTIEIIRPAETVDAEPGGRRRSSSKSKSKSTGRSRVVELFTSKDASGSTRRRRKHRSSNESFNDNSNPQHASRSGRRSRSRTRSLANGISVWLASMLRPLFFGRFFAKSAAIGAWLYLLACLGAWALLRFFSERTLPGAILAYGPRFPMFLPLIVLVPFSAIAARATLWPLALAALIVADPIMGGRFSPTTIFSNGLPAVPAAGTFRILTFNVEGGQSASLRLTRMLNAHAPDIVTMQECGDAMWKELQLHSELHSERYENLCTASRWPIVQVETMPRNDIARLGGLGSGGAAPVLRTYLNTPRGPLIVVNLHLETARHGLEGLFGSEGLIPDDPFGRRDDARAPDNGPNFQQRNARFEANVYVRRVESERASRWAAQGIQRFPIVVAGDFNLPVESTIFHGNWTVFTDAFEAKGNGLGWTKREGRWLRIRIDHVLTNDVGPRPVNVMVGPDYSSDHLPVIVDLAWPKAAQAN